MIFKIEDKEYKLVKEKVWWYKDSVERIQVSRYVVYVRDSVKHSFGFKKKEEDWTIATYVNPQFEILQAIFDSYDNAIAFCKGLFGKVEEEELDITDILGNHSLNNDDKTDKEASNA